MATDPRFLADSGREVFTGNELLIKGALEVEGGVNLLTGYPGSPIAGFFDLMGDLSGLFKDKGIRAFQANNEALSVAAVNGSQMAPVRAIAAFKSVGVHVASDALALGTLAGAHPQGGAVIICGEDPWCDSTQVPADSRFLCEHMRMAVVEPGNSQQLKDWIDLSFKLSQASGLYIGYIVTTAQADGGGTVSLRANHYPTLNTKQRVALDTSKVDLDKVLLPPRTWQHELGMVARYEVVMKKAREIGINQIFPGHRGQQHPAPLGFIVSGMSGPYLQHVLADLGLTGEFPILQMGMTYPADVNLVRDFSRVCKHMIVIEERRSFLEKNIRDSLFHVLPHEEAGEVSSALYGKKFPFRLDGIPETRGLNPSVLAQILIPLIKASEDLPAELRNGRLSAELAILREASRQKLQIFNDKVVARTPTFCPGCPHRDSSSVLIDLRKNLADPKYMQQHHGVGPVDLVAHGDTGCYTMLMFAPTEQLMHNYSGMGLGGGTGSGIDPFITNKQIVFMGDGTFFHSGSTAISNAIKNNQDITFIILENKTTAMTGHQEHAGTEVDALGNRSYIQDIEDIVRGMAGTSPLTVAKLNPANRDAYKRVLERTILADGVKVVIADKECGITYHRRQFKEERKIIKEKGYLPKKTHMNITTDVCENCLECTKQTACPGLTTVDTDYGQKIDTDLTWCVNDGACERVQTSNDYGTAVKPCPSFEQVTVVRKKRRRYTLPHMALDKLPEPAALHDMSKAGNAWRCHMSGVGGMGIGVVGAIMVRAGHKEGYRVLFQDKKGLAIRNGGVYSQLTFVSEGGVDAGSEEVRSLDFGAQINRNTGVQHVPGDTDSPRSSSTSDNSSTTHGLEARATDSTLHPRAESPARHVYPTTGAIPYGRCDLLLGIDILEAIRAIDPREQFRVASKERTAAVLNTYHQPTVYTLLGREDFDPDALREEIYSHCKADWSYSKNLSDICEARLGSKQFVNIMMLGVAYQLGLIPVSAHSIAWAIKDSIRRDQRRNIKAFNIGRKLALEPRVLPKKPAPETAEQLIVNKSRIIRRDGWTGRRRADVFEKLVQGAMKQMRDLPDESKYDLALRVYDLLNYQDDQFARRYIDLVRGIYRRDSAERKFAATHAAIWNLAKVMLIKDEPYVAYLLTRYEKKVRDIAKYGVDEANGDRLVYRHHTSPEFNIGKHKIRLRITTSDWQLRLVRHMKWWRKLPGWHTRETTFRDWYIGLLDQVNLSHDAGYATALTVLKSPEPVTGYREIRYPKMDLAKELVEGELSRQPKIEVDVKRDVLDAMRSPTRV